MHYNTTAKVEWRDKHSLFCIKVQVKNLKLNALFDSGSQSNLVYKRLVDELGLETYDHTTKFTSMVASEIYYENYPQR